MYFTPTREYRDEPVFDVTGNTIVPGALQAAIAVQEAFHQAGMKVFPLDKEDDFGWSLSVELQGRIFNFVFQQVGDEICAPVWIQGTFRDLLGFQMQRSQKESIDQFVEMLVAVIRDRKVGNDVRIESGGGQNPAVE